MIRLSQIWAHLGFGLVLVLATAWGLAALWVQLSGLWRIVAMAALGLAALAALTLRFTQGPGLGWAMLALAALVLGFWYQSLAPRQDRDWEIDVSRGLTARIEGERVTLSNLRDFVWTSETEATPRWISRTCDLSRLDSLDIFTSVWGNPDIAHLLVSFGFADCGRVVFSVEIRRERGEKFNELGGFFRQFEQVLIGATEEDIVKLRTNYRREEVRLYPVALSAQQRRTMFLSYLDLARALEEKPRFYNTLTANCTTTVWRLAKSLKPDLPLDWRLLATGRLPEYLRDLGVIPPEAVRDPRPISALARGDDGSRPFSDLIRGR